MAAPPHIQPLCPGFALQVDRKVSPWQHVLGGRQSIQGATCPNCEKPLLQHASIDVRDPRLGLEYLSVDRLPLLYCMRCALSWHEFDYQVKSAIEIVQLRAFRGQRTWDDWYPEGFGDELPRRDFDLSPIPERIQDLHYRITYGYEPTAAEELDIAKFTGNFASDDVGGYPIIDAINQVGGLTFFIQPVELPICFKCRDKRMSFLLSLVNDECANLRLTLSGIQILFFFCDTCCTVQAISRV